MKKQTKILCGISALAFLATFGCGLGLAMPSVNTAKAEILLQNVERSSSMTVEAFNAEGAAMAATNSDPVTLIVPGEAENNKENYPRKSFEWSELKKFVVSFNASEIDQSIFNEETTYTYTVSWAPNRVSPSGQANLLWSDEAVTEQTIRSGKCSSAQDVPSSVQLFVDNTVQSGLNFNAKNILGEKYTEGWGLYMFNLKIGNTNFYSELFEITPKNVTTLSKPDISVQKTSSDQGLNNAYIFSVDQSYQYVPAYQIRWSVKGKAKDGRDFVLSQGDIGDQEDLNAIYSTESIDRNGPTFRFDPPYEGTWTVTCTIFQDDGTTVYITSDSDSVSTVKGLSTQSIIWIVVAAALAAAIVVAVVIVVSIRREKVY